MEELELKVYGVCNVANPYGTCALVLDEVGGTRQLAVIINQPEAASIKVALRGIDMPRPLTHDMYLNTVARLGAQVEKVLIYKVENGVYFASVCIVDKEGQRFAVDARTSDAVSVAMRARCPIYTTPQILEREHMRHTDDGAAAFHSSMDIPSLENALKKAIEEEDYESAAFLSDEISRRQQNN